MKYLEITKEMFEAKVPVMRDATEGVWTGVQAALDVAEGEVLDVVGAYVMPEVLEDDLLRDQMVYVVSVMGARGALAQADVVLTDVGFGVVRNQNLAPASRERVAAVEEDLRRRVSDGMDDLLRLLLERTAWGMTAQAVRRVDSVLWSAKLCRGRGVRLDGRDVYEEERRALLPRLSVAVGLAEGIVSPELMRELVRREREFAGDDLPEYMLMREEVRKFLAVCLMDDGGGRRPAAERLLSAVKREAHRLPEYAGSSVAGALALDDYANGRRDASYFF